MMGHPSASKALAMTNAYGATPLHIAAASPKVSVDSIQVLGTMASAMAQDKLHRTPLHVASQNIHASIEVLKCLIRINPLACNRQSDGGYLPIHLAVHSQAKLEVVMELVDSFPSGIERESVLGDTPLHKAATNNVPVDVMEFLLDEFIGAIYKQNQMGDLPLHCATSSVASMDVMRSLVEVSSGNLVGIESCIQSCLTAICIINE